MDSQTSNTAALSPVSFDEFNSQLQAAALKATRNAVALPSDMGFHRSMDSGFSKDLDAFSSRVLSLTNNLLELVATADATQSVKGKGKSRLESQDDVVDSFHSLVVDTMDQLLERTDNCLDEYFGRTKSPAIAINPTAPAPRKKIGATRGHLDQALQHASHLRKPQILFKKKVVNNDHSPWYPTLPHKYNAQVPLGHHYHDFEGEAGAENVTVNAHPYRYEIRHISYPPRMFTSFPPIPPKSFADTSFNWIATPSDFSSMLEKLRKASEIAVDLEHHSYRTFAGFVCLMQISTREEDWVVDTLVLREELGELNEVFTDPGIVKVLHGAESDIVWLQQDFNLYIVNLFDTFHASKLLEFPRHGLANLLEMYCDFTADKQYQLADWRIRPVPEEMLQYARSDTHFLLFIYDNLRNALLDRAQSRTPLSYSSQPQTRSSSPSSSNAILDPSHALIKEVLSRSESTALRTYEKEIYDAEGGSGSGGWDTLARKWNKGELLAGGPGVGSRAMQREVYRSVHAWRDRIAREDDESPRFVLPNHHLFQLAERPPKDMAALLGMFQSVPAVVRKRAKELLDVIRDSCKESSAQPAMIPSSQERTSSSVAEVVEMEVDKKEGVDESRLWSNALRNTVASSSSLFGSTVSRTPKASAPAYSTPTSALFGNMNKVSSSVPSARTNADSRFRDLIAQIHSTLVIVPSAPTAILSVGKEETTPATATGEADTVLQATDNESAPGMQIEIPYVPESQRKTTRVVEDSIVVVGQARQKKRKRPKAAVDGEMTASAVGSKQRTEGEGEVALEPFDFAAVPNILDDIPNSEDMRQRKKKKQKQTKGASGIFGYGDFPAPPKAHSELKSGNQSHTFK